MKIEPGPSKAWRTYEEVAQHVLNELSSRLQLKEVQGKQVLPGVSGTDWEVDAKAIRDGDGAVLIIECRRYNSRLPQSQIAALAYQIKDTGAAGAITVSPLPLQRGAALVAEAEGIRHVRLDPSSTMDLWIAHLENIIAVGIVATVSVKASLKIEHIRNGKIIGTTEG